MKRNFIFIVIGFISILAFAAKTNTEAEEFRSKFIRTEEKAIIEVLCEEQEEEQSENELIELALLSNANIIENCRITHYCICKKCCGKSDGITKSGVYATPYITCAVDSSIIPLGSDILIDYGDGEIHYLRADDTGLSIKGNVIDICVSSHEEAIKEGVKNATVYWIKQ